MRDKQPHEHSWKVYKVQETSFEFILKTKCTICGKKQKMFSLKDDYTTQQVEK